MCEAYGNKYEVSLAKGETYTWSTRSTPGGGEVGRELGFSSNLKSEGTTAAVNIGLTEDYKLTSWHGGIPTI